VKKLYLLLAALVLVSSLESTARAGSHGYDIVDLSTLIGAGSGNSSAVDINNNEQIIGQIGTSSFLYNISTGIVTNLGTMDVHAINNNNQIVGDVSSQGYIYSGGSWINLGANIRSANGINDSGKVVGYGTFVVDGQGHTADRGYIYDNGAVTVLGNLVPADPQAKSYAYSINNSGQVVGKADYPNRSGGLYNAFLYSSGTMNNLGTLGGQDSVANVINNSGQIIGQADTGTSGEHTFLYNGSLPLTDLSTIIFNSCYASHSYDINNLGQIVGTAVGLVGGSTCFIYNGSTMTDLNTLIDPSSYYRISTAVAINDLGQIVATGKLTGYSNTRALLLTPAQRTWDGGSTTNNNWSSAANWNPDIVPVNGCDITFSGTTRQTNVNNTALTDVWLLTFANGGFNISGNALNLNAGINNTGNNTWAINSTLAYAQTFTSSSGMLTISGSVDNNGNLLTVDGLGNHLISGAISGTGGLTKSGSGTLTLSSTANNYKGITTVTAGVLEITGGVNIGATTLIDVQGGKAVLKTTNVNNNTLNIETDTDGTFQIADGIHTIGNIQGSGTTEVNGQLTANSICQGTLTIGSGSTETIAPLPDGPLSESTQLTAVPEPAALILIITGIFCLMYRRMGK
jgi:probable HAF family extracellular repeat protein/autotransporter-associated beta strand protein